MRRLLQWRPRRLTKGEVYAILTGVAIVAIPALIHTLAQKNYGCDWTGFGQCATPENTRTEKTLWDWMELLLVPLVLAVGGFIYNRTEKRTEQRIAQERADNDRAIAERHAQDAALQTYLDQMTELLLEYKLREPEAKTEVRDVARVRTLTALRRLDAVRRNILMRFLRDSKLISPNPEEAIIDLRNVDLSRVDLQSINLSDANLIGASLWGANLDGAILSDANLRHAELSRANLTGADLGDTNLTGAILMGTNLDGAILMGTNLDGADLTRAILTRAILTRAILTGADLSGADLSGAMLSDPDLTGAILSGTIMPDGSTYQPPDSTSAPAEDVQQADAPTAAESAPDTRQD